MKNKELLSRMTLEQRIRVILSTKNNQNEDVDDFKLPIFSLLKNPLENAREKNVTIYPKSKMLGCSWDLNIIKDVYKSIGVETKSFVKNSFFNMTNDLSTQMFSTDPYLNGKMIQAYINGLHESNCPSVLTAFNILDKDKRIVHEVDIESLEIEIKEGKPDAVIIDDIRGIEYIINDLKYDGVIFSNGLNLSDTIKKLNAGCSLVFTKENLCNDILEAVNLYNVSYNSLKNKSISKYSFDELLRNGNIISEKVINDACDSLISFLIRADIMQDTINEEDYVALDNSREPYFNEPAHAALSLYAARNSIVLLKNNGILPLLHTMKLALIGDFAINPNYQLNGFSNKPTQYKTTYELIEEYDINPIGFAHGYNENKILDRELINKAVGLAREADAALVYLYAIDQDKLSDDQLALIDELYEANIKIIAVLTTNKQLDMSFDEKCEALLLSNFAGQSVSKAILDILINDFNPSGRLTTTILNKKEVSNIPMYLQASFNNFDVRYPFGYGLSYSKFEYSYLEPLEDRVTFTIKNVGDYDGYVTPQLYVGKNDSNNIIYRPMLKGFERIFVRKNESIKVTIFYDEYTFRYYDQNNNCYGIMGGDYNLSIRDNYNDIRLEAVITLNQYLDLYKFENVLDENDDFLKLDNKVIADKKPISYKAKALGIFLIASYIIALLAYFIVANIENDYFIFILVTCIVISSITLFMGIKGIYKSIKNREKPILPSNDSLSDLVSKYKSFNEVSRVVYKEPVKEEAVVEPKNEQKAPVNQFDEEIVENKIDVDIADNLLELVKSLNEFINNKGILIDIHQTKRIFSAIISNKLVIIKPNDLELGEKLINAIKKFFGSENKSFKENDEIKNQFDLLWKKDYGKYIYSDFTVDLKSAIGNKALNIVPILDVTKNIYNYFDEIFNDFIVSKKESIIELGKNKITIPKNICFILLAKDDLDKYQNFAFELKLELKENNLIEEFKKNDIPSYNSINDLLKKSLDEYFLDEEIFKKFDQIEEFVKQYDKEFKFENKTLINLECYSSVLMSLELTEGEAIIDVFKDLISGIIRIYLNNLNEDFKKELLDLIDKLFGSDTKNAFKFVMSIE